VVFWAVVGIYCVPGIIPGSVWGIRRGMNWAMESMSATLGSTGGCGAMVVLMMMAGFFMAVVGIVGWPVVVKRWLDARRP